MTTPSAARLLAGGLALAALPAAAQTADLSLALNGGLDVGEIVAGPSAGTVTVSPQGLRSAAGGVALGGGLAVAAASFTVTGEPGFSFSVLLPGPADLANGDSSMILDTFTSSPGPTGSLGPSGTQQLEIGATLHVSANQPGGTYGGTFAVTVAYE